MRIPTILIVALGLAALSNAGDGGCDSQKCTQELGAKFQGARADQLPESLGIAHQVEMDGPVMGHRIYHYSEAGCEIELETLSGRIVGPAPTRKSPFIVYDPISEEAPQLVGLSAAAPLENTVVAPGVKLGCEENGICNGDAKPASGLKTVDVRGYTRKDGTNVGGYSRSAPGVSQIKAAGRTGERPG